MTAFERNLRNSANWYLYIFIDANAKLPSSIMAKRKAQLTQLNNMAKLSLSHSFEDCVNIVRQGIIDRYGKTPSEVLQNIYNVASEKQSIGNLPSSNHSTPSDKPVANITLPTKDPETGTTKESNIWTDIASVITWIVELLGKLGLVSNVNVQKNTPYHTDWESINNQSSLSMSGVLPYLLIGGVGYGLYTSADKSDKKRKKKKANS